jgi:hypothetical protein
MNDGFGMKPRRSCTKLSGNPRAKTFARTRRRNHERAGNAEPLRFPCDTRDRSGRENDALERRVMRERNNHRPLPYRRASS